MAVTYSPQTGITGSVQFGAYTYCASSWDWNGEINVIPAPSFCGGAYMEYANGKKSGTFSFAGTWDALANPFLRGLKLGQTSTAIFRINNSIVATAATAIVQSWNIHDESDGLVSFNCTLLADFVFLDFSNTAA